ncbi:hypothetical protein AXG93_2091s1060 [Marchantia polymorpha subsp. ruderalis]|uniref:Uncharacterized protein n=1 Tax=Marchantia polymorpha subsp. ruderalis TaxID=1480154 RepID=A0A176W6N7_MARPO|nr:hypothetical protein AXG93_2091s1060 [Marchantia polymorpha subsp. ruderalis]
MMMKQQSMPSVQVSSGTVDLDCDKESSSEDSKSVGLSAADMLGERIIPLLRYLDVKMAKYAELAIADSYVELIRSRTRAKVATSAERDYLHATELAAKAKELLDCEAARSLELEQRERLDADCNKM